jgi:mannose-6-phosphate isomerase-like protein (cupin superfamily)
MNTFSDAIKNIDISRDRQKHHIFNDVIRVMHTHGYVIDDVDLNKPWGFYIRLEGSGASQFIEAFFPGLTYEEACLGNPKAALSPKILLVSPGEILSWQYHNRRAERWAFLTEGAYYKSLNDEQGEVREASVGEVVQFAQGERHRLAALQDAYVLVAEIWQHTDKNTLSDEADIVRLEDKYQR